MSETPRLRSAFPSTPQTNPRLRPFGADPKWPPSFSPQTSFPNQRLPPVNRGGGGANPSKPPAGDNIIPSGLIDAPTQRLYVAAFYIALTAWRIYDYWHISNELDSTWLFLKWLGIDIAFFATLPALRIPWLEWSFATVIAVWLVHAVANAFLMFQIPIPLAAFASAIFKRLYDRELAIDEHRVKPGDIIQQSSIIRGKQIIQILPEASAALNPEHESFCLSSTIFSVELPISINQTTPMLIELQRFDLDTYENETLTIHAKQARTLKRHAEKGLQKTDHALPRILRYPVSKTGVYRLLRVVDESKLDVRKRSTDILVVPCPEAVLRTDNTNKCTGDLSDVSLTVTGTPPFKVRYSKQVNNRQSSSIVQNVQPSDVDVARIPSEVSNALIDGKRPVPAWTKSTTVSVEIKEALNQNGTWLYAIETVEDGLGNKVAYAGDVEKAKDISSNSRQQVLVVHNRPKLFLAGCDAEKSLRVAKEDTVNLPVQFQKPGQLASKDWPLYLSYSFIADGKQDNTVAEEKVFEMSDERSLPRISKAGMYSVESIRSQFCVGEVNEPSSCLLYNPPQPNLTLQGENIFDKCAGNSIGMVVNLDFTGTPPFRVRYSVTHRGVTQPKTNTFNTMRGQLEFREASAGAYTYQFLEIEDEVYGPVSLKNRNLILEQDIKPPASAFFMINPAGVKACLGQSLTLPVKLLGEGPWDLDYELVQGSKRKRFTAHSDTDTYSIVTPEFLGGGKQSIVLTGVQDRSKCRMPLQEERTIEVRPEQPRAAFGDIEGRRSVLALEGKPMALPVRLKGIAPWTIQVSNTETSGEPAIQHVVRDANAAIAVHQPGTYEILSVHDTCPGVVDPSANSFKVSLIPRPSLDIRDPTVQAEAPNHFGKAPVCQGDEDALGLRLTGNPPFLIKYQQKSEPLKGPAGIINKPLSVAGTDAMIRMDTSRPGEYIYTFNELSDDRYDHDVGFRVLAVQQRVYALPSARFLNAGKTYGYCKDDTGGSENIPIALDGVPPFSLEIGINHHSNSKPEIFRVKDILANTFSWSISRHDLDLGTHNAHIRSVKDSRGCERIVDHDTSSIRITVSDPPTVIPLESQIDYCVGERVSYSLSGQPPFEVFYRFQGSERKAKVPTTNFRRIAEQPGEFTVTGVSDSASGKCKASKNITKIIHPMPSVKISKGATAVSDIHEGGEVDIMFEFTGTPPFEFT